VEPAHYEKKYLSDAHCTIHVSRLPGDVAAKGTMHHHAAAALYCPSISVEKVAMRRTIASRRPLESVIGYSRAVAVGNMCFIAGCTALGPDGAARVKGDMEGQARPALETVRQALVTAGFVMADVARTVIYMTNIKRWEQVAAAQRAVFSDIRPAATMVEMRALAHPDMLVEIEATAVQETG
jgi:enamine deaminase RidA (YjgF/YER057c/UK114 family)